MIRSNHYDAAFEEYLRQKRTPYVAVDETRRALLGDASLKSMDFIVYCPGAQNILVDVKGRKRIPGTRWKSWTQEEDIDGLTQWEKVFGGDFRSLFVFAYNILENDHLHEEPDHSTVLFRAQRYAFYGVWVSDYQKVMKLCSLSWKTVWIPAEPFRECRFPIGELFAGTTEESTSILSESSPTPRTNA